MKHKVASAIAIIAEKMADCSAGRASTWGMFQPKVPAKPAQMKK